VTTDEHRIRKEIRWKFLQLEPSFKKARTYVGMGLKTYYACVFGIPPGSGISRSEYWVSAPQSKHHALASLRKLVDDAWQAKFGLRQKRAKSRAKKAES
jgi:hypothetical protein